MPAVAFSTSAVAGATGTLNELCFAGAAIFWAVVLTVPLAIDCSIGKLAIVAAMLLF